MLVDTHSHIHDKQYKFDANSVINEAKSAGVEKIFCVGTSANDSAAAVEFVQGHPECVATIGLHPHEAVEYKKQIAKLKGLVDKPKVVAVGECGLDYYYLNSPKPIQASALAAQIELSIEANLPMVFHVRQAFADFWKIFDGFSGIRGVIHSFTGSGQDLDNALARGLHIALNGIITFTKNEWQIESAKAIPPNKLLLETDAPFLTPVPFRGKVNTPVNVQTVAKFVAKLRNDSLDNLAKVTTANAQKLFKL